MPGMNNNGQSWLDRQQGWFPWWQQHQGAYGGNEVTGRQAYDNWFSSQGQPGAAPAGAPSAPAGSGDPKPGSEEDLIRRASGIEAEETRRYESGLSTLMDAYNSSKTALSQGVDASLLFGRAADSIGARARGGLDAMRRSMGARGLNPNSGAANGMLSRLMFERENALTGATRDIALENQRSRERNAALNFANAANLAGYVNSPVSGAGLETSQNIFEGNIAREGIASAERSQKRSAKAQKGSSMASGLVGLIPKL